MGRMTKVDRAKKQAASVKAVKATQEEENLPAYRCMACGREMGPAMRRYTVKYRKGGIAVVCPLCAHREEIRLKTPYVSVDAVRLLKLEKECV